jgi:type VI secretion system protein VasG
MTELHMNNLKILIKKLSNHARVALEKSANSCINQQNYEIEIEHFFLELLEQQEPNDLHLLVEKYKISHDFLVKDLPTPLGPTNMNTPCGLLGSSNFALDVLIP